MDFEYEFKKKLQENSGEAFQSLFEELMELCYPYNFQKITPYGKDGDKGNDGYLKGEGIFFQVYGPKTNADSNEKYILKKIDDDIEKILSSQNIYWEKVKEWIFVYNDFAQGITPKISKKIFELSNRYGIKCNIWGINKLVNIFFNLPIRYKIKILNIPSYSSFIESKYIYSDDENWRIFRKLFNYFIYEIRNDRVWFGKSFRKYLFFEKYNNILVADILKKWNIEYICFFKNESLNYYYRDFKNTFFEIWNMISNYYIYDEDTEKFECIRFDENEDYIYSLEKDYKPYSTHDIYRKKINLFQEKIDYLEYTYSKMEEIVSNINNGL